MLLFGVVVTVLRTITLFLEHLVDHILDVSGSSLLFDLGPLLHDCVFKLDSQLVLAQGLIVGCNRTLFIVVENVIQRERQKRCKELLFNELDGLLQVLSFGLNLFELVEVEHVAGHCGAAHEVCIGIVLNHERAMVDDGTPTKSLNDEVLVITPSIVLDSDLDNTLLDQDQLVGNHIFLANQRAFFESETLHAVD